MHPPGLTVVVTQPDRPGAGQQGSLFLQHRLEASTPGALPAQLWPALRAFLTENTQPNSRNNTEQFRLRNQFYKKQYMERDQELGPDPVVSLDCTGL